MKTDYDNSEYEKSGDTGFASGFIAGAALGAVTALLFAPMSGKQTRKEIKAFADRQKDHLINNFERVEADAVDVVGGAEEELDAVAGLTIENLDDYAEKAGDKLNDFPEKAKSKAGNINKRHHP